MRIIMPTGLPITRTERGAELVRVIPDEIPDGYFAEINREFENFMFEERSDIGFRKYLCTNCYREFTNCERTVTSDMDRAMRARHNEYVLCPHCGAAVEKKLVSKCAKMLNLNQTRQLLILVPESHDRVWGYRVFADKLVDHGQWKKRSICIYVRAVYCWEPGGAVCFMSRWDGYTTDARLRFEETKNPGALVSTDCLVRVIGMRGLDNSFLKYSQLGLIGEPINAISCYGNNAVIWLAEYCVHPQIEFLAKAGFRTLIAETLFSGLRGGGLLNWNARSPWEFFKMTKGEFNEFSKFSITLDRLRLLNLARKSFPGLTIQRFNKAICDNKVVSEISWSENLKKMFSVIAGRGISFERCMNYIGRQKRHYLDHGVTFNIVSMIVADYCDYISDCVALGLDLDFQPILMPADLNEEHLETSKRRKVFETAHLRETFEERRKKLEEFYRYNDGEIMVRVPQSIEEIIDEGKALNHCVGSYAERHANGMVTILFVRSCAEPDKPLYTMQLDVADPWKLVQIRAYSNGSPDVDTYTKIKNWLDRKGKPKKKEKTA